MLYLDTISVTEPGTGTGGSYDPETGEGTGPTATETVVLSSNGDYQDGEIVVGRDAQGTPTKTADGIFVLPRATRPEVLAGVSVDSIAVVTLGRESLVRVGRVVAVEFMDQSLALAWVD